MMMMMMMIEYEKENLAMLCLVNTVVWRWDMDHNQSNEDTYRSIWVMGL